jgi:tetratricopeptide (TPR) repeat protein
LLKNTLNCLTVPHSAGLVHGSLSPATIRFADGAVFLSDFALSQLIKLDYQSGIDPRFTSPEQVRGETPLPAADIYSLGCVLSYMLSGNGPFNGNDAFNIALKHVQGDFPALPEPFQFLQPLLEGMTKGQADERLSVEAVLEKLETILSRTGLDDIEIPGTVDKEDVKSPSVDGKGLNAEVGGEAENDFSARIEARLRDQATEIRETMEALETYPAADGPEDTTEGLEQVCPPEDSRFWRYILLLLIGVLIGSGSYFFFFDQRPPEVKTRIQVKEEIVPDPGRMLDQALVNWREGNPDLAEAELKKLSVEFPQDPRPLNNLAVIAVMNGNYDQARQLLEQALATNGDYATVYNNLGAIYTEMARDSYGKALQLDREQAQLRLSALSSQGETDMTGLVAEVEAGPVETAPEEEAPSPAVVKAVAATDASSETRTDAETAETAEMVLPPETDSTQAETVEAAPVRDVGADEGGQMEVASPEAPEEFLKRWAGAWSAQDVEAYLTFYAETFIPSAGRPREGWAQLRRKRISRPQSISVKLSEITSSVTGDDSVRMNVVQEYQSDIYSDRTRKVFDLRRKDNSWKIVSERSLGAAR